MMIYEEPARDLSLLAPSSITAVAVSMEYSALCSFLTVPLDQDGRFCSNSLGIECCLPCPSTEWIYPDCKRNVRLILIDLFD